MAGLGNGWARVTHFLLLLANNVLGRGGYIVRVMNKGEFTHEPWLDYTRALADSPLEWVLEQQPGFTF
jgi:hypothetical protein